MIQIITWKICLGIILIENHMSATEKNILRINKFRNNFRRECRFGRRLGGRFGYFYFFCSGRGKGQSEAGGGISFLLKIPGGGGGAGGPRGREGVCGKLEFGGGGGLNILGGRNVHQGDEVYQECQGMGSTSARLSAEVR